MSNSIVVYNPPDSNTPIELQADFTTRVIWVTQRQLATVLDLDVSVVSRHIANFKKERGDAVYRGIAKFAIPTNGGVQEVEHYDMTIAAYVGFRAQATDRVIAFQNWVGSVLEQAVAKIVPSTSTQALLAAVQKLVDLESEQMRQAQDIRNLKIEKDREVAELHVKQGETAQTIEAVKEELHSAKWQRVKVYCEKQAIKYTPALLQRWSREATALSNQLGYEIRRKEVQGKAWDTEKAYHTDILAQICGKYPVKASSQTSYLDDE